jgi:hypothetical protein
MELRNQQNEMIFHRFMNDHIHLLLVHAECLRRVNKTIFISYFSLIYFIDPSLSSDSIGSKLMKKHGWQEGQGLGKKLQGRADPLEVNSFEKRGKIIIRNILF